MPSSILLGLSASLLTCLSVPRAASSPAWCAATEEPLRFNRDVRPVLANHCFECHGPDDAERKAGLRLDQEEDLLGELGPVVPGSPGESELVRRILSADPSEQMPPPDFRHPLGAEQRALLERWVAEGAVFEDHWAYAPLRRAAPQPFSSPSRPSSAARTVRFGPDAIHEDGEEASAGGRIGARDRSDPPGQASQDEKYAYEPPAEQPVPAIEPPERYKPPADLAERAAKAAAAIDAAASNG